MPPSVTNIRYDYWWKIGLLTTCQQPYRRVAGKLKTRPDIPVSICMETMDVPVPILVCGKWKIRNKIYHIDRLQLYVDIDLRCPSIRSKQSRFFSCMNRVKLYKNTAGTEMTVIRYTHHAAFKMKKSDIGWGNVGKKCKVLVHYSCHVSHFLSRL